MKVLNLFLWLLIGLPIFLFGQINFIEHIVDDNAYGTASIYACDLDGDTDLDVLGALYEENKIVWWRNDGGNPFQWTRFDIETNFLQAGSVYAADLDGDSIIDVLGVARVGDLVAWWHNDGGNPIQWTRYIIRAGYDFAHEVYAHDLDQDGDMDVLGASSNLDEITWWRNDGGFPVIWTEQTIGSDFVGAKSVHVADFDDDDTLDVVGAAIWDNDVTWWRNDGGEPIQWTEFLIDGNFFGAHRVQAIDMNDDDRPDVVGAAYLGHEIAWWRNDGGDPITWTKQIIGTNFFNACIAQAIDLDGDGDLDVLGTAQSGNQVAWWRNDNDGGEPFTWTKFVIDSLPRVWPLYACDLDNDTDNDVVAASGWAGTNEVKWWENQGTHIEEETDGTIRVDYYPTIVCGSLILSSGEVVRIYDISGRIVSQENLQPGIYFVKVEESVVTKIIKIK
jgi:hypothetical protein